MPPAAPHRRNEAVVELPNVARRDLLLTVNRMAIERVQKLIGTSASTPTYILCSTSLAPAELLPTCVKISCDRARKKWSNVRALARLHGVPFIFTIDGEDAAVFYRHPDYRDDMVRSWLEEYHKKVRMAQIEREQHTTTDSTMVQRVAELERRVIALEEGRHNG
ncbi:hypothetical protein D9623_07880 [Azospirillum brasilense]|uniref:Uncharacterized protein n=1 Tax=Azospirillum brasilense TaxID=192 RepID=A0ABU4P9A8_AZOBR|nr:MULTISPECIES: hypothetical protein [Azospirillum]ALJ35158.1 hypothetical protein AMK58_06825 [Azospirillum brasilense]MDW7553662.1 hypothetical protein [Azospirillum brasilense]MDW7594131.1 hypothetical protein [Azospirillum brasilense]MDW7629002.1 hypothetical protein [Azospirillum brasilense]MDX5953853.1 hypothetical protein [Azospirillum brasilense]